MTARAPRADDTIRRELRLIELMRANITGKDRMDTALWGAQQALLWALGYDAQKPSRAFNEPGAAGDPRR